MLSCLLILNDSFRDLQHLRQDFIPGFVKDSKALIFGGDHVLIPSFPVELAVGGSLADTFGLSHSIQVLLTLPTVALRPPEGILNDALLVNFYSGESRFSKLRLAFAVRSLLEHDFFEIVLS